MFLYVVVDTDESILQFHGMLSVLQRVFSYSLTLTLSQRERAPSVYVSYTARRYRP
jgi:hypothetical protein